MNQRLSDANSARFYAHMIYTYMTTLPEGCADQMVDVQLALGLSDDEMELGLRWCVERGLIVLSPHDTDAH